MGEKDPRPRSSGKQGGSQRPRPTTYKRGDIAPAEDEGGSDSEETPKQDKGARALRIKATEKEERARHYNAWDFDFDPNEDEDDGWLTDTQAF